MYEIDNVNVKLDTMTIMQGVMTLYNYRDTAGMVFFHGGGALKISNFFDFFQEEWISYKTVTSSSDDKKIQEYLKENNGGIATNGSLFINLKDVVAMLKVNEEDEEETD